VKYISVGEAYGNFQTEDTVFVRVFISLSKKENAFEMGFKKLSTLYLSRSRPDYLPAMLQNQLLFLIDDDIDDQEIFKSALAKVEGSFEVLTANNGQEALQLLAMRSVLPDYIFVDLNMPRMGGLQFLKEIKKSDSLKHIPVIIYSTSANPADMERTRELGAVHFITKPARFSELCKVLQALLN
jgi:CheY-like chemotaxis protein